MYKDQQAIPIGLARYISLDPIVCVVEMEMGGHLFPDYRTWRMSHFTWLAAQWVRVISLHEHVYVGRKKRMDTF